MQIGRLCSRDIVSVNANTPVHEAARVMRNNHVGALVVTDARDPSHAVGILTDRDLVIKLLALEGSREASTVDALCSHRLVMVPDSAEVDDAVRAMLQAGVRRVLVQDAAGGIRGVLSVDDLFDALATELENLAKVMRSGLPREEARIREAFTGESMPSSTYLLNEVP